MYRFFTSLVGSGILLCSSMGLAAQQNPGLPVIEHHGRNCYYYTLKGNESIFGLLSRFGWDEDTFMTLNPTAATLKKGDIVFYPVEDEVVQVDSAEAQVPEPIAEPAPAVATVIDRTAVEPMPSGAIAQVQLPPFVYTLTEGDNIYTLARRYHTSVYQIFSDNPGLEEYAMSPGMKLRISPGVPAPRMERVTVSEKKVTGTRSYKPDADGTWQSIAAEARVPLELLMAVNEGVDAPEKGKKIRIPLLTDTLVVREREYIDPREESPADRRLIYNEAHALPLEMPLGVTVLIGNAPESRKRDLEFVRGFLLGLNELKGRGYPVKLHVREADPASLTPATLAADTAVAGSRLIVATYDKEFPRALGAYADSAKSHVINVFDAKSDMYLNSPSTIQLLPSSADFYGDCASYLLEAKDDAKYIFIAEDEADGECISLVLLERLIRDGKSYETIPTYADLAKYPFVDGRSYVIVSDLTKRADITKLATDVEEIVARKPALRLSVVGRPTWVVYADVLREKLQKMDTYIPSRFFLDTAESTVQDFDKSYTAAFGSAPLKSFPAYAAMGYDVARYFVPATIESQGDLNRASSTTDSLQLDFSLTRPEVWTGMLGGNVYMLHFTPYNTVDKIRL